MWDLFLQVEGWRGWRQLACRMLILFVPVPGLVVQNFICQNICVVETFETLCVRVLVCKHFCLTTHLCVNVSARRVVSVYKIVQTP